jgi:hypothetical protein
MASLGTRSRRSSAFASKHGGPPVWRQDGARQHAGTGGVNSVRGSCRFERAQAHEGRTGPRTRATSVGDERTVQLDGSTTASGWRGRTHTPIVPCRAAPRQMGRRPAAIARSGTCWLRPGNGFAGIAVGPALAVRQATQPQQLLARAPALAFFAGRAASRATPCKQHRSLLDRLDGCGLRSGSDTQLACQR